MAIHLATKTRKKHNIADVIIRAMLVSVKNSQIIMIGALVLLREKVLRPILAGVSKPKMGRKPKNWSLIDQHYETIRQDMFTLFQDLRIAA